MKRAEVQAAIIQRNKLWAEGDKLLAEIDKLLIEGDKFRAKGSKLRAEKDKLWYEGNKLQTKGELLIIEAVLATYGNVEIKWTENSVIIDGDKYEYTTE